MALRLNFFDFPHKAFRFMWMELVQQIGSVNYGDDAAVAELAEKITFATDSYAHHNHDESEFFGPRLQELDAVLTAGWLADHDAHLGHLQAFKAKIAAIQSESDIPARGALMAELYTFACRYLADDLDHMMLEQTKVMETFQGAYSDDQLREMEGQFIQERVDPEYMKSLMPLFLRAGNIDERTFTLSIVQKQVPSPEAFAGMLEHFAAQFVPADELATIRQRLGA